MPNDFNLTLMSSVCDPLYDDFNKTVFLTKVSPAFNCDRKYEVALVDYVFKNTYDILRKDRTYDIKLDQTID